MRKQQILFVFPHRMTRETFLKFHLINSDSVKFSFCKQVFHTKKTFFLPFLHVNVRYYMYIICSFLLRRFVFIVIFFPSSFCFYNFLFSSFICISQYSQMCHQHLECLVLVKIVSNINVITNILFMWINIIIEPVDTNKKWFVRNKITTATKSRDKLPKDIIKKDKKIM